MDPLQGFPGVVVVRPSQTPGAGQCLLGIWRSSNIPRGQCALPRGIGQGSNRDWLLIADTNEPLWDSPDLKHIMHGRDWHEAIYRPCCYASFGTGSVRAMGSMQQVANLQASCHHLHTREADVQGEFTAQEAIAVVGVVASVLGFPMAFLPAASVGNRIGAVSAEPDMRGETALSGLTLRYLGRATDTSGVGARVPTGAYGEYLAARTALTPKATSVSQVAIWKAHHLYVGRACPRLKLEASVWANPFKASGPEGRYTPERAVALYEAYVRADPSLLARLPQLSGTVLVCHCRTDAPCHRQVLIKLFDELVRAPVEQQVVYVGKSHFRYRMRRTKWCSPYMIGTHGGPEECVLQYADSVKQTNSLGELQDLVGRTLVCECPLGQPCHIDAIDALLRGGVAAAASYVSECLVPQRVVDLRRQREQKLKPEWRTACADAFRSLWPFAIAETLEVPDLSPYLDRSPFNLYRRHILQLRRDGFGPLSPVIVSDMAKGIRRASEDSQSGTFFAKGAVPQAISLGLDPMEHFEAALQLGVSQPFPMDASLAVDEDVKMVARVMADMGPQLPDFRRECFRALVELEQAMQPVSLALRAHQHPQVAQVAGQVHIGLIAAAVVLMAWPDTRLPYRYLTGFRCLGQLEPTGVLRHVSPGPGLSQSHLLKLGPEALAAARKPPRWSAEDAQFLAAECAKDEARGFGSRLYTEAQLDELLGKGAWLPMPRFLHVQPNGKRRPIDDGSRHDHNQATSYSETLDCVTAIQPGLHLRALAGAVRDKAPSDKQATFSQALEAIGLRGCGVATGTEDMPDAYRFVPCHPDENAFNVVSVWEVDAREPRFQVMYGHVFGRAAAVINFHRLQRLITALGKRWICLLMAFYYDDASVQDFTICGLLGQRHLRAVMAMLGLPLSAKKQVDLQVEADYLGLLHDVSQVAVRGVVSFRPRPAIKERVLALIDQAFKANSMTPADASKLRGVLGFISTASFGQVGRGGAQPLIFRQYADRPPFPLTHALRRALQYFRTLQELPLARQFQVWKSTQRPIVVATDGRVDDTAPPSIAFVAIDLETHCKIAAWSVLTAELRSTWQGEDGIALVEESAILLAVQECGRQWEERDILWYVDNSVVLASMSKGASRSQAIDHGAATLQLVLAGLRIRVWWEYIESKANWSDALSRDLKDPWLQEQGFTPYEAFLQSWPWTLDHAECVEFARALIPALGS